MTELREHLNSNLESLRTTRYSWWTHWRELSNFILPRRYNWLIQANQMTRGDQINQRIIDSTGTIAARSCAAGMMAGITSPTRPWFKLKIEGFANDEAHPVSVWLSEVEKRMMRVFQESNFYNSMAVCYHDLVVFGTAVVLIYEDFDSVIRCYNPCAGEYFLANSDRLDVNVVYREFVQTAEQLEQWFGEENLPNQVKNALTRQGKTEFVIGHALEPNDGKFGGVPKQFRFREFYWLIGGASDDKMLAERGFFEFPALCPRWDLVSNDAYGRSPGMDALPDIKQLQQETKRKAQGIDKMVNPPLLADVQLKNQPASVLPGAVTYVAGLNRNTTGMAPIYQVAPPIQEMKEDIAEIQTRIQRIFFNDLFMMFQQLQAEPRSAAAIDARREEKLIMLGPVLERFENEALDPVIERTFNVMLRAGLLPPPPQGLPKGETIEVSYVSMLAEAQRAVSSAGIERLFSFAGNLQPVFGDIIDNLNGDEAIADMGNQLGVSPKIVRSRDEVMAMRKARQEQQQAAQGVAVTSEAVNAAKVMSETDVGGGVNALQAVLGNTVQ